MTQTTETKCDTNYCSGCKYRCDFKNHPRYKANIKSKVEGFVLKFYPHLSEFSVRIGIINQRTASHVYDFHMDSVSIRDKDLVKVGAGICECTGHFNIEGNTIFGSLLSLQIDDSGNLPF